MSFIVVERRIPGKVHRHESQDWGTLVESPSIVRHLSNPPVAVPRHHDAMRQLDKIHRIPHSGMRGNSLLKLSMESIIVLRIGTTHHRSRIGVRGGVEQAAKVKAIALADEVGVISWGAERHGSRASPKCVV